MCIVSSQVNEYCNQDESAYCFYCDLLIDEDDDCEEILIEFNGIQLACSECLKTL